MLVPRYRTCPVVAAQCLRYLHAAVVLSPPMPSVTHPVYNHFSCLVISANHSPSLLFIHTRHGEPKRIREVDRIPTSKPVRIDPTRKTDWVFLSESRRRR